MLYEIDFTDEVGDGDIGRGEFFLVTIITVNPFDLGIIALLGCKALAYF